MPSDAARTQLRNTRRTLGAGLPVFVITALFALPGGAEPPAPKAIHFAMDQDSWSAAPGTAWVGTETASLKFARYEGMPSGNMTLNEAVAEAKDAQFSNGTIEFDMKPLAYSDTGIIFRRHGTDAGEFVYARANPDCPAADDCVQYAPIVHGHMHWNIYPDFQGPAPIAPNGWNHFRLVVAGSKMLVYVNRLAEPSLIVPKLQGLTIDGGIAFKGPAIFANLTVRDGSPDALAELHVPRPDPGTVTAWATAAPVAFPASGVVSAPDIPPAGAWRAIAAESSGLVNLGREFGAPEAPAPAIAWLKTNLDAARSGRRNLRIGWTQQVSVFLNGEKIFSGENAYYPEARRLSVNGRLEADNATLPLLLRAGRNEIVLAVGDRWTTSGGVEKLSPYGWAAEAHFDAEP